MKIISLIRLEWLKLFRRSNIIFFFLAFYVFFSVIFQRLNRLSAEAAISADELFLSVVNSFAFLSLVMAAIFMVNNIGNELNEGSMRKSLAVGLSRSDFFSAKLLIILFLVVFILISTILVYLPLGILGYNFSLIDLIKNISPFNLLNQSIVLFHAGLFGLFFIMVFRNRSIGLVFFPFWAVTEFILHVSDRLMHWGNFTSFLPGVSSFWLYNSNVFDLELLIPVIVFSAIFATSAWYGFVLREEKPQ